MATFTITTNQNIDELSSKAGNDTYNVNGATLTIDQDSRYGLNQNTSAALGTITISATQGGTVNIDGRFVRLIPFNTGTGNVPASGTVISQGSASGKLIGVWSSLTSAPTASGSTMPSSGFIKIKQWNSVAYSAGGITGIGASSTGVDIVGWIDVVGAESKNTSVSRLGNFNVTGEWYEMGNTSGSSSQTIQLPNSGQAAWFGGIFIEKNVGAGDFEFYPNAGSSTDIATDVIRGKVVWISGTGLVRIGNNGTATAGYTPAAGLRVVIGNVFLHNCTAAVLTANCVPNATFSTRHTFTGVGSVSLSKCAPAWYAYFSANYSIDASNLACLDRFYVNTIVDHVTLYRVGVGQTAAYTLTYTSNLVVTLVYGTCSVKECVVTACTGASNLVPGYFNQITNIDAQDNKFIILINKTTSFQALSISALIGGTVLRSTVIGGNADIDSCIGTTLQDTIYVDMISGTTLSTNPVSAIAAATNTNCIITGLTLPVSENNPYTSLIVASSNNNCLFYGFGTRSVPLVMGTTNKCGTIVNGGGNIGCRFKRIWVDSIRLYTFNPASPVSNDCVIENCGSIDYSGSYTPNATNCQSKGLQYASFNIGKTMYGVHFCDSFTSSAQGNLSVITNEKTVVNPSCNSYMMTGTAIIPSIIPSVGDTVVWEWPHYILGHTGFQNNTPSGLGNYIAEYQIDKNDGNGYSVWRTLDGTTLSAETGISASAGFKLKIRLTTTTANTSSLSYITILTNSSSAAQAYQYSLSSGTISMQNIVVGSSYWVAETGNLSNVLASGVANSSTVTTGQLGFEGNQLSVTIRIRKKGYKPFETQAVLTSTGATSFISQSADPIA